MHSSAARREVNVTRGGKNRKTEFIEKNIPSLALRWKYFRGCDDRSACGPQPAVQRALK
jgi:hypothetical protein